MTGHSIYIDCAKNMRDLMATFPSALTEGIDLHMGDPDKSDLPEIVNGYKGVMNGNTIMTPDLLKASAETLRTVVFLGTGVANYVDSAAGGASWAPGAGLWRGGLRPGFHTQRTTKKERGPWRSYSM